MKSQNKANSLFLIIAVALVLAITGTVSADEMTLNPNGETVVNLSLSFVTPTVPSTLRNHWGVNTLDDGDTSYVGRNGSSWDYDLYTLEDPATTVGSITKVTIYIKAKAESSGIQDGARTVIGDGTNVAYGSGVTLTDTYTEYYTEYTSKPTEFGGGTWGWTDISSLQAGVSLQRSNSSGSPIQSRCTLVYVVVEYTVGGSISGAKFYDTNTNGVWDEGEPAIEGFKIELYDDENTLLDTQFTDENGEYLFDELDAGTYIVKEVLPSSEWINTTDDSITIEDLSGPSEDNNFGNVCVGCDSGGHGLGFWGNNNGAALIGDDDLALLVSLNLRNDDGTDFDPVDYDTFEAWSPQGANATNMAYMLSAQLAAMELNVLNEFVGDEALVYAPGTNSANAAGFASIGDLMSEADAELGLHGTAIAGDDWRNYQEALKDVLDAANNNVNFVCPEPCLPIVYP
jgi:hypothetical protein